MFSSFLSVLLAVDENDTHASATHTSTTTITTTTTTTTTTTSNTTTTNRAKAKLKFPKSTLNRPQPLYSQKIVIGSEELAGRDIEHVVRQRINALINPERSPKVVRSTALIIKSSKAPASANGRIPIKKSPARDGKITRVEVSELDGRGSTMTPTTKTANGCANLAVRSILSNGFDRQKAAGKSAPREIPGRWKRTFFFFCFLLCFSLLSTSGSPILCVYVVVGLCFVFPLSSSFMLRFRHCVLHGLAPVMFIIKGDSIASIIYFALFGLSWINFTETTENLYRSHSQIVFRRQRWSNRQNINRATRWLRECTHRCEFTWSSRRLLELLFEDLFVEIDDAYLVSRSNFYLSITIRSRYKMFLYNFFFFNEIAIWVKLRIVQ